VMPLSKYTLIHSDAKMNQEKIKIIKEWVQSTEDDEEPVRYKKEFEKD